MNGWVEGGTPRRPRAVQDVQVGDIIEYPLRSGWHQLGRVTAVDGEKVIVAAGYPVFRVHIISIVCGEVDNPP